MEIYKTVFRTPNNRIKTVLSVAWMDIVHIQSFVYVASVWNVKWEKIRGIMFSAENCIYSVRIHVRDSTMKGVKLQTEKIIKLMLFHQAFNTQHPLDGQTYKMKLYFAFLQMKTMVE